LIMNRTKFSFQKGHIERGMLLPGLNYLLLSWAILCKILEMADVETSSNRATPAKNIRNSFTNRSAIFERTPGILPRRLPLCSGSTRVKSTIDRIYDRM
jgi:hypothetical protein